MDAVTSTVKNYILTTFLPGENPAALTESTALLEGGILDSLGTLDLVAFLEKEYDIELEARDVEASRLGTLADIAKLVHAKRGVAR